MIRFLLVRDGAQTICDAGRYLFVDGYEGYILSRILEIIRVIPQRLLRYMVMQCTTGVDNIQPISCK